MAWLAGSRHGVELPAQRAGFRVIRLDATTGSHFAAVEANDDQPVVIQRRSRDRKAVLPALRSDGPDDLARALVKGREPRIGVADEYFALADCDAAAGASDRTAALRVGIAVIRPKNPAGVDLHREYVVRTIRHVEGVAVHQDLGLARVTGLQTRSHSGAP